MGPNRLFGLSLFSCYFSPQQVPSPVLSFPEIPSEVWADFVAGWPGIPSAVPAGQSPLVEAERVAAAGSHGEWPQSKEVALVADVVVGEAEPVVKASAKSGSAKHFQPNQAEIPASRTIFIKRKCLDGPKEYIKIKKTLITSWKRYKSLLIGPKFKSSTLRNAGFAQKL